ncbi:MAG: GAF domain-containing protein [Chitinophagaceae bacterium]|nr:GAF domain-containing protein [Chitinophagaceae bacterium]
MRINPAFKITLIYCAVGFLWIYLSDRFLFLFFQLKTENDQIIFQNIKGFFYVIITGYLLYALMKSFYKKNDDRLSELEVKQQQLSAIQTLTKTGNWEYDILQQKIIWSEVTEQIFEVDASYKLNHDFILTHHLKHKENKETVRNALKDAEVTGASFDLELEIVSAKGNEKWIKFVGKPVVENSTCIKIIGSYQDITELKNKEEKIIELSRLYHVITDVNKATVRLKDELTLFKEVCEIAVTVGLFRMAWIGKVDEETQTIVPIVHAGAEEGYLSQINIITYKDEPLGRGPTGSALREGKHFVCNDIETDPRVQPWRDAQLKRGYKSSISLPITKGGKVIGAFTLYAPQKNFFDNQEVELLKDATADLAYALENMEKELLRQKAESNVLEALERYDIVSKATSDTIWDWDIESGTIFYNKGISNVFGYTDSEIVNTFAWKEMNIHKGNISHVKKKFNEVFYNREQIVQCEYRFRCADGRYKFVLDRAFVKYNANGDPSRVIGTMQDITSEIEYEIRVEKAVITTQEQERLQIGMELHDNVNQILSVSLLYLGMIKENNANGLNVDGTISKSEQYIKDAINEIRRLSHELAPVSLKDISLHEAFEILTSSINENKKISIKLHIDPMDKNQMPGDLKINMYRILQEQMNNIVKYAEATEVTISLTADEDFFRLMIVDNGKGFEPKVKSKGIGLENMRRRAKLFSGEFKLNTSPGNGCEVIVEIPLLKEQD